MKNSFLKSWPAAWLLQILVVFAVCTLILVILVPYLPSPANYWALNICMWGIVPALGSYTSFKVTRTGVNNYAAWVAPPLRQGAACILWAGSLLNPGYVMATALISLVGAAAGDVLNKQDAEETGETEDD